MVGMYCVKYITSSTGCKAEHNNSLEFWGIRGKKWNSSASKRTKERTEKIDVIPQSRDCYLNRFNGCLIEKASTRSMKKSEFMVKHFCKKIT